ncbi:MAG TPA: hypothetical protein VFB06_28360 [Streptosporangiaceae bacterium]|nr:hypothetical protein [Streptosporangiaceae bacterium]
MAGLGQLTTGELKRAEDACALLMGLYTDHAAFGRDTFIKIETLWADIQGTQQTHMANDRRARVAAAAKRATTLPTTA